MTQSAVILAAIFAGFLVFITLRGELGEYRAAIVGSPLGDNSKANK